MSNKPDPEIIAVEKELARMSRIGQLQAEIARKTEAIRHLSEDVADMRRRISAECPVRAVDKSERDMSWLVNTATAEAGHLNQHLNASDSRVNTLVAWNKGPCTSVPHEIRFDMETPTIVPDISRVGHP
jgi:alcohol dehydrogenase class IV